MDIKHLLRLFIYFLLSLVFVRSSADAGSISIPVGVLLALPLVRRFENGDSKNRTTAYVVIVVGGLITVLGTIIF